MRGRSDLAFIAVNLNLENKSQTVTDYIAHAKLDNLTHAFSGNAGADETFSAYGYSNRLPQFVVIEGDQIIGRVNRVVDVKDLIS